MTSWRSTGQRNCEARSGRRRAACMHRGSAALTGQSRRCRTVRSTAAKGVPRARTDLPATGRENASSDQSSRSMVRAWTPEPPI